MAYSERRYDERDRLRDLCRDELAELREADEDETSEVAIDAAARAAAHTASRLSRPESDAPSMRRKPPSVAIAAALVTLAGVASVVVEALRRSGWVK